MLKASDLQELWKKSSFKEAKASYKQNILSRDNLGQRMWDKR